MPNPAPAAWSGRTWADPARPRNRGRANVIGGFNVSPCKTHEGADRFPVQGSRFGRPGSSPAGIGQLFLLLPRRRGRARTARAGCRWFGDGTIRAVRGGPLRMITE